MTSPTPPPPAQDPRFKISRFALKWAATLPEYYQSPPVDRPPAPTGPYFCYGTLTDPSMIAAVLNPAKAPEPRPAYIEGYKIKRWGLYPDIVDAPGLIVEGFVYNIKTVEDSQKLAVYASNNRRAEPCRIKYTDDQEPSEEPGYTFKFAGNPRDLSEGTFDLRAWLKRMGRESLVDKLDEKKYIE